MIKLIKQLFQKKKEKPKFIKGQRIVLLKRAGARNKETKKYCSIENDMVLIFQEETKENFYFKVRCNFAPSSEYEAKDQSIVFFSKRNFKSIKYRTV